MTSTSTQVHPYLCKWLNWVLILQIASDSIKGESPSCAFDYAPYYFLQPEFGKFQIRAIWF